MSRVPNGSPAVGLVFDLDNTLIASHIDFAGMRRCVIDTLEQAKVPISAEQMRWTIGRLAELAKGPGLPGDLVTRIWQIVDDFEVAGMEGATLEPGASIALSTLYQRGYAMAVLTNNARASALRALKDHNLQHYFQVVLCRDDVQRLKPAPDGLQAAARLLGNPKHLIMIGDSWLDAAAAAATGAQFVAVGRFRQVAEPLPVWKQISTLHELPELDLPAPKGVS